MQQLIKQLTEQYNFSEEEATDIIYTVKNYLSLYNTDENSGEEAEKQTTVTAAPAAEKEEGILEKAEHLITDHIPGGFKEKAEEMFSGAGDKVKGLFN